MAKVVWSELTALRALAVAAILVSFYLNINSVPLFDVDEGAFSQATREMFARADFISTYLNGEPRYDKPILIYWLQAASTGLFGINEFAFRLPSALAATGWIVLVIWFVGRLRGPVAGYLAGCITALALSVSVIAKAATADALLNLFIVASLFAIYLYYQDGRQRYIYAAFACVGLGFLTKGPVAVLIPFAVSLIFFALKGQWREWARAAFHPRALMLFVAIVLPWYAAQYIKEGQAFIDGFFLRHNIGRFQGPMESHGGSLLYYLPVVLVGVLPFTALLLKTVGRFRELARDDLQLYLIVWFLFVLLFFSLSGTKLPHYINYGLTGILILMALNFTQLRSSLWSLSPALLFFAVLLFLPEIIAAVVPTVNEPFYQESLRYAGDHFGIGYRIFFMVALGITAYLIVERSRPVQPKLLLTGLGTAVAVSGFLLPALGGILQQPIKGAAMYAKDKGLDVVQWRLHKPSFSVYREEVTPRRRPQPGEVVLTTPAYLHELGQYELLYVENGAVLVRLDDEPLPPVAAGP